MEELVGIGAVINEATPSSYIFFLNSMFGSGNLSVAALIIAVDDPYMSCVEEKKQ